MHLFSFVPHADTSAGESQGHKEMNILVADTKGGAPLLLVLSLACIII